MMNNTIATQPDLCTRCEEPLVDGEFQSFIVGLFSYESYCDNCLEVTYDGYGTDDLD